MEQIISRYETALSNYKVAITELQDIIITIANKDAYLEKVISDLFSSGQINGGNETARKAQINQHTGVLQEELAKLRAEKNVKELTVDALRREMAMYESILKASGR